MHLRLLLILGLVFSLTACTSRRGGGGGGSDDDDDDSASDDDDDDAVDDDDDATDDDDASDDDDVVDPPDDDDAVDDDDTVDPDDDDTVQPDDDDTVSTGGVVDGQLTFLYFTDAAAQNQLCIQVWDFEADATWGTDPAGANCPTCTGYLDNIDLTFNAQTDCQSSDLGDFDVGPLLTDLGMGGDYARPMAIIDLDTVESLGLALNDDDNPTVSEQIDTWDQAGFELSHFLLLEDDPSNFWISQIGLDANGANNVPGSDWFFFWSIVHQGTGANSPELSGSYIASAMWRLTLGDGPSGPEVV